MKSERPRSMSVLTSQASVSNVSSIENVSPRLPGSAAGVSSKNEMWFSHVRIMPQRLCHTRATPCGYIGPILLEANQGRRLLMLIDLGVFIETRSISQGLPDITLCETIGYRLHSLANLGRGEGSEAEDQTGLTRRSE